jgi:hypothetical protein
VVAAVGFTVIEGPLPALFVHPASVYHFHDALAPNCPPATESVVESPEQTLVAAAVTPVAAVDGELT